MALVTDRSKAVVLLLQIHSFCCFYFFFGGGGWGFVFGACIIVQYLVSFLVLQKRDGCFTLIASWCHVTVSVLCLFFTAQTVFSL